LRLERASRCFFSASHSPCWLSSRLSRCSPLASASPSAACAALSSASLAGPSG
jgi:hypothetical protein